VTPLEERLRAVLRDRLTDTEKELLGVAAMARVEALKNRTAAPGATGTAAKAAPLKGSTAMSHDLTFERTALGQQMTAAMVLAHLIERGPREEAEWKVDTLGRIHGHVHRPRSDEQARRCLDQFANFLGSVVARSQSHGKGSEWIHLSASGTYRGVQVNVWTHVGIRVTNPYGSGR
jgi:hypothetical protein